MNKEESKQTQNEIGTRLAELKEYLRKCSKKNPVESWRVAIKMPERGIDRDHFDEDYGEGVTDINIPADEIKGPMFLYQKSDLKWIFEYDGFIYHLDKMLNVKVQRFIDNELTWEQLKVNLQFIIEVGLYDELRPEEGYTIESGLIRGIIDGDPYPLSLYDPDEIVEIF